MANKLKLKHYQNKRWLENQYTTLKKPTTKIAEEIECCRDTISKWLKLFEIPIRSISEIRKGTKHSEETKKKISVAHNGLKHSEETKKKMSDIKISLNLINEKNHNWKGDDVGYSALHQWLKRNKPKSKVCEICGGKKKLDLASKTHEYTRNFDEYQWLCRSCHSIQDSRHLNLKKNT